MTSRSRSSLVSKIFASHGVWWGNTPKTSRGYQTYENQIILAKTVNQKLLMHAGELNIGFIQGLNLPLKSNGPNSITKQRNKYALIIEKMRVKEEQKGNIHIPLMDHLHVAR